MNHQFEVTAPNETAFTAVGAPKGSQPAVAPDRILRANRAARALGTAAKSWFVVTVLGQLMFVVFIVGFYGRAAASGRFETWNKVLSHGWVPGDTIGNLVLSLHLSFAALITAGGALQLISGVRRLFPVFHRWNGRVYLLSAAVMSLGGLSMVARHGTNGDPLQSLSISINALLILGCAGMALRHALARRFDVHRRWALRLFLVVSGGWFFRIGLMFWILVNQGPAGFDPETFRGPAITILGFAQYVLPLCMLELYFRAQVSGPRRRIAMASALAASTLVTATGIVAASMMLWLPHLATPLR